ncbi:MAG TPA: hypothetical protein VGE38_14275 [Nocardioides sp.]|uniref:hypothetical protein n=1 Tax=Nocardioides sp. TaxID=35761 RepID=UPI002ED92259
MLQQPIFFSESSDDTLVAPPLCGLVTVPALVSQVTAWCARPDAPAHLVIDLSGVVTLDPGTLRALAWAGQHCASQGKTLGVRLASAGVLTPGEEAFLRDTCRVESDAVPSATSVVPAS